MDWLPSCLVLAAVGIGLVLYQTRFGPGASGDSSSYLMGAENLLRGNGFSRYSGGYEIRPITGFPPFLSVVLATIGLTGLEPMTAARFLNAALFGANIALTGYLVYAFSRSGLGATIAAALILMADTLFELHSWVMSEPLFIFLTLAASWSLLHAMERASMVWLVAAGLLTACASLTRYVGPALSAAGGLVLLLFGAASLRRRALQALIYAVSSLLPVAFWLRRNAALAGTLVNRDLAYHPMEPELLRLFLAEVSSWFVPHQLPLPTAVRAGLAVILAGGILAGFAVVMLREWTRREGLNLNLVGPPAARYRPLPWLLGLYIAASVLILYINSTFLDASTGVTAPPRYLAPIYACLVPLIVIAAVTLIRRGRWVRWLLAGYLIVWLGIYATIMLRALADPLPHLGYTGRRQLWSEAVVAIREVPSEIPLVSNNPELVYILVGRPAYVRPISFDHYEQAPRTDYEEQFTILRTQLAEGGVFVLFDEMEPDDQALIERMGLRPMREFPQLRLYAVPAAGS